MQYIMIKPRAVQGSGERIHSQENMLHLLEMLGRYMHQILGKTPCAAKESESNSPLFTRSRTFCGSD